MFQLRGGDAVMPNDAPSGGTQNKLATYASQANYLTAQPLTCGYGYQPGAGGVCMSSGCFDQRSPCTVRDQYGKTCSYDQLLAYQHQTGVKACGPGAPSLPSPPITPGVPPPPIVQPPTPVPGPGTVINPTPSTSVIVSDPGYPISQGFKVPKWALALGGLTLLGIVIAVVARR